MFRFGIEKTDDLENKVNDIKDIAKSLGYASGKDVIRTFLGPDYPTDEESMTMGWTYNTICEVPGFKIIEDYMGIPGNMVLELPDPINFLDIEKGDEKKCMK